jgi:hypothetical protein
MATTNGIPLPDRLREGIDAALARSNRRNQERADDAAHVESEKRLISREAERVTRALLADFAEKNGLKPLDDPDGDGSDED